MKETHRVGDLTTDLLNISGELIPELDAELVALLERGKNQRVEILRGTEGGKARKPYAVTHIEIDFESEHELSNCVRLLRWSDERLRARPDQMVLWDWQNTNRERMKITFGVAWYDKAFFERRKDAFKEPSHVAYYSMFGATPDRFRMTHRIVAE